MNWLKWTNGRQGGKYQKKLLFQFGLGKYGMDCYLIKFEPFTYLMPHKDIVDGKHLRLNYVYKGTGDFRCENKILDNPKLKLFRADINEHSMLNWETERRVLSIGLKY